MKVKTTYIYLEGADELIDCDIKLSIEHGSTDVSRVEISTQCKGCPRREVQSIEVPGSKFKEILHGKGGLIDKLIEAVENYKNYGN